MPTLAELKAQRAELDRQIIELTNQEIEARRREALANFSAAAEGVPWAFIMSDDGSFRLDSWVNEYEEQEAVNRLCDRLNLKADEALLLPNYGPPGAYPSIQGPSLEMNGSRDLVIRFNDHPGVALAFLQTFRLKVVETNADRMRQKVARLQELIALVESLHVASARIVPNLRF